MTRGYMYQVQVLFTFVRFSNEKRHGYGISNFQVLKSNVAHINHQV